MIEHVLKKAVPAVDQQAPAIDHRRHVKGATVISGHQPFSRRQFRVQRLHETLERIRRAELPGKGRKSQAGVRQAAGFPKMIGIEGAYRRDGRQALPHRREVAIHDHQFGLQAMDQLEIGLRPQA